MDPMFEINNEKYKRMTTIDPKIKSFMGTFFWVIRFLKNDASVSKFNTVEIIIFFFIIKTVITIISIIIMHNITSLI